MTLYAEPRAWLEQFPLGEPTPFSYDHLGLRYTGEVIRTDSWSPAWAQSLTGDVFFRIVLLRQRQGRLRPTLRDRRIAVCVPAPGPSSHINLLTSELATIRETQAVYFPHRDPEGEPLRRTLERRQEGLEEQLMVEESLRYAEGRILTGSGHPPDPATFFFGTDPSAWFSRLARWLLAQSYASLPIDPVALPRPVTEDDAASLFCAVFAQPGATSHILAELGPGLGLSSQSNPGAPDPTFCQVFPLIRQRLSPESGTARWADVHRYLAHEVGLTGWLATLYLLVFLHQEGAGLEVRLAPGHGLKLLGEQPLLGTRLTSDLIPVLLWDPEIGRQATTIEQATQPRWNDALNHLSGFSPGLVPIREGDDFRPQEPALLRDLAELGRQLDYAQGFLALVGPDADPAYTEKPVGSLERLSRIGGDNFRSVYRSVREVYRDYRQLQADLDALRQLAQLGRSANDIRTARQYLAEAAVPSDMRELSMERQTLRVALSSDSLLQSSRSWHALSQEVSGFKSWYAAAYRAHHEGLHGAPSSYKLDLDLARRKLRALDLLNTLPELGGPEGSGLAEAINQLPEGPQLCLLPPVGLDLEAAPRCSSCGLGLEQSLPNGQLARLLAAIDKVLGEKNRRLSNLLVERILQGQTGQRLDDFLRIIQASDLSALSDTLSPELAGFIRRILG